MNAENQKHIRWIATEQQELKGGGPLSVEKLHAEICSHLFSMSENNSDSKKWSERMLSLRQTEEKEEDIGKI